MAEFSSRIDLDAYLEPEAPNDLRKEEKPLEEEQEVLPEISDTPASTSVIEVIDEQLQQIKAQESDQEEMFGRLKELFPSVHPFEKIENKEYLSITPREIEFFKKEYITLVNNSFLLHGYQNYKYLILGRDLDLDIYSIGVPGVYYEKEEMMAKMFGFNKFLPALNGEVAQGSFGYYTKVLS